MSIGKNIKSIRISKGLTQKELADKLGITQQSVAQYERTKRIPKIATLKSIADALGVTIYDLQGASWMNFIAEHRKLEHDAAVAYNQHPLIAHYNKLNELGKNKAIERVEELTEIKKYTDPNYTDLDDE